MKTTLLILTLFCSFQGFGQSFLNSNLIYADTIVFPSADTIPILILYCDTTSKSITVTVSIQPELQNNQLLLYPTTPVYETQRIINTDVFWMEGYLVTSNSWDPNEFLDIHKKRIPENIIIWNWIYK